MAVLLRWNGEKLLRYAWKQIAAAMDAWWIELQRIARQKAGVPNIGMRVQKGGRYRRKIRRLEDEMKTHVERYRTKAELARLGRGRAAGGRMLKPGLYRQAMKNVKRRYRNLIKAEREKIRARAAGSYTVYPHSSRPGESPRRRTGFGQKNIVGGRKGDVARVGYAALAPYMLYHELGIRYRIVGLQRRPTIVPACTENVARLTHLMHAAACRTRPV